MIWETYRNEFNRNKLKLSETETMIPRVDLTEPTPTAPVAIQAYIPCPARRLRRVKRSDFQSKSNKRTIKPTPVSRRVKKAKYYHICPQTFLCILQFTPEMLYLP